VKLVQNHRADAVKKWVLQHLPVEHTFGQDTQTGFRTNLFFKADVISHLAADLPAIFLRDPHRRRPCGHAPRLKHDHIRVIRGQNFPAQNRGRHPRRLSRAGLGDNHNRPRLGKLANDQRQMRVNRQGNHPRPIVRAREG
jgi:hypothetical protein